MSIPFGEIRIKVDCVQTILRRFFPEEFSTTLNHITMDLNTAAKFAFGAGALLLGTALNNKAIMMIKKKLLGF